MLSVSRHAGHVGKIVTSTKKRGISGIDILNLTDRDFRKRGRRGTALKARAVHFAFGSCKRYTLAP